jgi:hypothetical protein
MNKLSFRQIAILVAHAFVGWALCGLTMFIGREVTTIQNALIIHAVAAPIFFAAVSWSYFRHFAYTGPLATALFFVTFVITMDFFLVGLIIEQSLEMFTSFLGTWLPFSLIFLSTYLAGRVMQRSAQPTGRPKLT